MKPLFTNKDIVSIANSIGLTIRANLPKCVDECILIDMMENCKNFVNTEDRSDYMIVREIVQEISNRLLSNLLEATDNTVQYYKMVAENTEGNMK